MDVRRCGIYFGGVMLMVGLLGLYQNATVVDFTQQQQKSGPATEIEQALLLSEQEHLYRQKKMGVSTEQTSQKLRKKNRAPAAIGDIPFYKKTNDKKNKKKAPVSNLRTAAPVSK